MVDLHEKLKAYRTHPSGAPGQAVLGAKGSTGIVLPSAFIAVTKVRLNSIPEGVEVIAERNVLGNFQVRWWNSLDQEMRAAAKADDLDYSQVYESARAAFLAEISDEDLAEEIRRRNLVATAADDIRVRGADDLPRHAMARSTP